MSATGDWRLKNFASADGMIVAVGQRDAVREGKFLVAVFQVRRERDDVAVKMNRLAVGGGFEPVRVAPAREPLQQFGVGQQQRGLVVGALAVRVVNPLDELPVPGREQFLFVGGADHEVHEVVQRARLFARARAEQQKLHGEAETRRLLLIRLRLADHAQRGARRVQVQRRGRRQPVFQFPHQPQFLLGLLGAGKTVRAGVRLQFRRHGALGAQKQKRQFLQARLAGAASIFGHQSVAGKSRRESESFSK